MRDRRNYRKTNLSFLLTPFRLVSKHFNANVYVPWCKLIAEKQPISLRTFQYPRYLRTWSICSTDRVRFEGDHPRRTRSVDRYMFRAYSCIFIFSSFTLLPITTLNVTKYKPICLSVAYIFYKLYRVKTYRVQSIYNCYFIRKFRRIIDS